MFTPFAERYVVEIGNEQRIYRFENGYGASVVRGPWSYGGPDGLFEAAVLRQSDDDDHRWPIDYSTPITNNVIGHLTEEDVQATLARIAALPAVTSADGRHEKG